MRDADVVIVGAGAAGLSLALRLCAPPAGRPAPRVVLVEPPPGPLRPRARTWCYWEAPGGEYDPLLAASWERLRVRGADGRAVTGAPPGLRYKMLRSGDFTAHAGEFLATRPGFRRLEAVVHDVSGRRGGAEVHATGADGAPVTVRAAWVLDSRPPLRLPPARTTLLQHFRGWFVRTERDAFTPGTADLMDFRTPQPDHGLSFGYVLPLGRREALVEYTEFGPRVLADAAYDAALAHYTTAVLGLGPFTTTGVETGVIPMTDARFPRRPHPRVLRVGTAGGATRPATGYTFAAIQRQARAVAALYHAGRPPVPPPPHPARARAMDAVLLRALDRGRVAGPDFFTGLFERVPTERVLRFLDGRTRLTEDIGIGLRTPVAPMLRTAAELPLIRRRVTGARTRRTDPPRKDAMTPPEDESHPAAPAGPAPHDGEEA